MKPDTKKSTGNEIQRADFLSTLRTKLGVIANVHSKIVTAANDYVSQGFSEAETEELLHIDGYDPELIKTCMRSLDSIECQASTGGKRWGFNVEDFYGRIISHAELNATIFAENEEEATEKAEEFISTADSEKGMERIVDVFELD